MSKISVKKVLRFVARLAPITTTVGEAYSAIFSRSTLSLKRAVTVKPYLQIVNKPQIKSLNLLLKVYINDSKNLYIQSRYKIPFLVPAVVTIRLLIGY